MILLDAKQATPFIPAESLDFSRVRAREAHNILLSGSGPGNDFLGWRSLLMEPDETLLKDIEETARGIRSEADVLVCIGIGGSYLGAKAVIEALTPPFRNPNSGPEVLFAGTNMSAAYLEGLLAYLEGKSVFLNVISKSGTTLEPAIAFRILRSWMESRFDDVDRRIVITTDPEKGALNALKQAHDYKKYIISDDVGGRFSVLTPVGLLPIAVAGIDISALFRGAMEACDFLSEPANNPAVEYAALRFALLNGSVDTEVLATFEPALDSMGGWWQQLFGESEGKAHSGLFPVSVRYSADLHSLGQYIQEGKRNLMETFLMVEQAPGTLGVSSDPENLDGLNYLAGKPLTEINRKAYEGTAKAHMAGGVPVLTLWMPRLDATSMGGLIYFFEHAVAVGGYMLGINPFDQPGVEAYKKEMFSLLGKP